MIITCPNCNKQFKIDNSLIPDDGRDLQCGSCNHTWFFNKYEQSTTDDNYLNLNPEAKILEKKPKSLKKKYDNIKKNTSSLPTNKGSELVKYKPKSTFSFGKFLSYLIVLIITIGSNIIIVTNIVFVPFSQT